MDIDALLRPVAEDMPCGPDLNAGLDPEYDEYYFGALGRLPGFYFQPGVERPDGSRSPDRVFDPRDVDIAAEEAAIDALLDRSRDLRLLVLRAQWQALAGRLGPMAQSVRAIADLLDAFGDALHPGLGDGPGERRDALNDLASPITVIQPLQFAGLTGTAEVTLRKIKVVNGQLSPLQDEEDLQAGMLMDALGNASYAKKVGETHAAMLALQEALARIARTCRGHPTAPFSPAFDKTVETVGEILDLIAGARPDLRAVEAATQPVDEDPVTTDAEGAGTTAAPAAAPPAPSGPAPEVASHARARQVLEACELYYRRAEPSSAALLLVTQARLLVGKPLVEALTTLLPQQASQAVVEFGPQSGFAIGAERLYQLSQEMPQGAAQMPPETDPGPPPVIETGPDAAAALRAVEDFFRRCDRSSPVPVLLQRARSYLDRDFQSLVDELIPRPQQ